MASEPKTGALLAVLSASKPGGRLLELGTGTGVGTSWLLAGMDPDSHLDSIDTDARAQAVARRHLEADRRVTFHLADGAEFLTRCRAVSLTSCTPMRGQGNSRSSMRLLRSCGSGVST